MDTVKHFTILSMTKEVAQVLLIEKTEAEVTNVVIDNLLPKVRNCQVIIPVALETWTSKQHIIYQPLVTTIQPAIRALYY